MWVRAYDNVTDADDDARNRWRRRHSLLTQNIALLPAACFVMLPCKLLIANVRCSAFDLPNRRERESRLMPCSFRCDDVTRRARVSRAGEQHALPHRETTDGLRHRTSKKRGRSNVATKQPISILEQILGKLKDRGGSLLILPSNPPRRNQRKSSRRSMMQSPTR